MWGVDRRDLCGLIAELIGHLPEMGAGLWAEGRQAFGFCSSNMQTIILKAFLFGGRRYESSMCLTHKASEKHIMNWLSV